MGRAGGRDRPTLGVDGEIVGLVVGVLLWVRVDVVCAVGAVLMAVFEDRDEVGAVPSLWSRDVFPTVEAGSHVRDPAVVLGLVVEYLCTTASGLF